uniref:HAP1 N-terminal domain-containing protein n=1 Tax=Anopheles quadriannulatus TaxID=34691 RepID=A0A182X616_ANOQN
MLLQSVNVIAYVKATLSIGCLRERYILNTGSIPLCEQYQSKLAASQCGARIPLSPNTQATIEKHLPGLPSKRLLMQQASKITEKRDVGCITEVCSAEDLPEVEIFSLLEEQIPRYKIRADTTTTFGGYENQDWFVQYPALPIPTEGLGLTTEQTREALNYFRQLEETTQKNGITLLTKK